MYLQRLSLSGFRGVGQQLDLPLGHRTVIYGPSGSGKSSLLQAVAWAIYGKLPILTGGVFTREDALVNDFLDGARAEVTLTLSDGITITRRRDKQTSTTKGKNPLETSFAADDPQVAVEQLIGLNPDEFFAAVFLHQETIRDFITTTPEERSATIDRMIGTSLLRSLVKAVDPKVPAKAIEEAQEAIERLNRQLSQASVISREVIRKKKAEHGDPAGLPKLLADIGERFAAIANQLGMPAPEAMLTGLVSSLAAARQAQLNTVSALENQAGQLRTLRERYDQAAVTGWEAVHGRRKQYGDPADLPHLLVEVQQGFAPIAEVLGLPVPGATIAGLDEALESTRQSQAGLMGELEQKVGHLGMLKQRYEQAAIISWQPVQQRIQQYGDPADVPGLLSEIQERLASVTDLLALTAPGMAIRELEESLAVARRTQPRIVGDLEREIGRLGALRERHEQASKEVVEDVAIPPELEGRRDRILARTGVLNQEIPLLERQLNQRREVERELAELRGPVDALPALQENIAQMQERLAALDAAIKQGSLYTRVVTSGLEYFEQIQPEACPLCRQRIVDLQSLLETLHQESPADIEGMRKEHKALQRTLLQKQSEALQVQQKQSRIEEIEAVLVALPKDIESQIKSRREEGDNLAKDLIAVQAEISQVEGRIKLAEGRRKNLESVRREVAGALGPAVGEDICGAIDEAVRVTRDRATRIQELDFEPISSGIDRARQLNQIKEEEARLRQQLDTTLQEVGRALGREPGEDVTRALEEAIHNAHERIAEVKALDFQPITAQVDRAKQLGQITEEEAQLRRRLDEVRAQVGDALGRVAGQDVAGDLDGAIRAIRERISEVQGIDLQPIQKELERARYLDEIQQDENQLREFESSYQTATRERARLDHQIRRLTDLRDALQDIAETTKQHQQQIVTGLLETLDIHHYYQQLDPHPAYRRLQVEPELTGKGTYNYWIKALTDDRSHGTYVQTRFSTAQANCAAIAIFLAVNQHLSKRLETIILDDPCQSLDPDYKLRLARTLAASPRQVIVATEDPQMFTFLADVFEEPVVHQLALWTIEGSSVAR